MKKKNKEGYTTLQAKLRKLESDYSSTKEKLKMYGLDGDFSENHDWHILQEKSHNLYQQIILLKEKLNAVKKNNRPCQVFTYLLLETGEQKSIQLANEWEADPNQNRVSFTSPLGLALSNKKVGEIVEVKIKQKKYTIQIITIK